MSSWLDPKWQGQSVVVAGMGASGLAMARYLSRAGARVTMIDTRENPPNRERIRRQFPAIQLYCGHADATFEKTLCRARALCMSPGLSMEVGVTGAWVRLARSHQVEVMGEIELFAQTLAYLKKTTGYSPRIVGITGTNGKTTTTVLTARLLQALGWTVKAAGNIGPNAITELWHAAQEGTLPDAWVLELSSFQLASTQSLHCDAATLLNITEDHIDWHGSMSGYARAKKRIFAHADVGIVPVGRSWAQEATKQRYFGASDPQADGYWGLVHQDGELWIAYREARKTHCVVRESDLLIRGRHNTLNAMVALALVQACGANPRQVRRALITYRGEAHRVEVVARFGDLDVIDDSKGTNVGAVQAALEGLGAQGKKIFVLMGGDGKGQDFAPLLEPLQAYVKGVALIGMDREKIATVVAQAKVPYRIFASLEEAVHWLWRQAQKETGPRILLLSPACASWDMFKDYAERSARFIAATKKEAQQSLIG